MRLSYRSTFLGLIGASAAQFASYSPPENSGVTYAVNIPSTTAQKGSGEIFFQIRGPSSSEWLGLGQGQQMAGANIFVVYADADGKNVTLSPRLGLGEFEPNYNSAARVTLLAGSGISGGNMIANVRCDNCQSWSGGQMSVTDTASNWIWAVKDGSPVSSDSKSQDIPQHDNMGGFTLDLTKGTGGTSLNPFVKASTPAPSSTSSSTSPSASSGPPVASSSSAAGASPTAITPIGSGSSSGSSSSDDDDDDSSDGSTDNVRKAHAVIMSLAFV